MSSFDWLDQLNPPQKRAVTHRSGPLLVLAGAGSGKTRVLTRRIAHLIEVDGVDPDAIVALTFTNRAADEMRQRVDGLVDDDEASSRIVVSTFHSLGARLLRRHAPRAGLARHFSIYDADDQRRLVSRLLDRMQRRRDRARIRRLCQYINRQKNRGRTPTQAIEDAFDADDEEDAHFYRHYQQALDAADAVDFGDLILKPLVVFRRDTAFARRLSNRWRYLHVDEFQDTNPAQYELLEHLCCTHDNLAVVGDDDQSIYRWRGAELTHILGFEDAFDDTEVVKLEQNYRSTKLILDAANDVIAHNERRHPKKLWTQRPRGEPITVFTATDDREEASFVADRIFDEIKKGRSPDDFAIFYRTNAQGRLFEEQLRQWGLEYRIVGGLSFYERREVKDVLAYLRAALNPCDDLATARMINTPRRGIGEVTMDKLVAACDVEGIDHLQDAVDVAVDDRPEQSDLFASPLAITDAQREAIDALDALRTPTRRGIEEFRQLLDKTRDDLVEGQNLATVVQRLLERTDYIAYLESDDPETAPDRIQNIGELLSAIADFESDPSTPELVEQLRGEPGDDADDPLLSSEAALRLRAFLDRSSLLAQHDGDDDETITLMTVHGAKGLEFDTVFLVGMEDRMFPHLRTGDHDDDQDQKLAEERRLAYVAITRAENQLYITNARRRRVYGKYRRTKPSRFLLDIDAEQLQVDPRSAADEVDYVSRTRSSGRQSSSSSTSEPHSGNAPQHRPHQFDQSPADAYETSFNQSLPDWTPDEASDDGDDDTLIGVTVSHSRFGPGEVLSVSGRGDEARLTVDFPGVGQKTVVRRFLKVLG